MTRCSHVKVEQSLEFASFRHPIGACGTLANWSLACGLLPQCAVSKAFNVVVAVVFVLFNYVHLASYWLAKRTQRQNLHLFSLLFSTWKKLYVMQHVVEDTAGWKTKVSSSRWVNIFNLISLHLHLLPFCIVALAHVTEVKCLFKIWRFVGCLQGWNMCKAVAK